MSKMHRDASPKIFERARGLRATETNAGKILWTHLRNRRLNDLKFRRQHPVIGYVVDFYCHQSSLVIELDGGIHQNADQKAYDRIREKELVASGLKIVRFDNTEVTTNYKDVLRRILAAAQPPPTPPEGGELNVIF